jgi:chromate reductase
MLLIHSRIQSQLTRMKIITIIGISGSIRQRSSSHVVLEEIARLFPQQIAFELYEDLASLPAFDGREEDPEPVKEFKAMLKKADGIFISSPEYAFGVPGALKNALDWTVGSGDFVNKPVALITASSQGEKAHESMQHILTAIAAILHPDSTLLISSIRSKIKDSRITDVATQELIQQLVTSFLKRISALELNTIRQVL